MFYLVPPAGTKYQASDIVRTIIARFKKADHNGAFESIVRHKISVRYCHIVNSGRSAMTLALNALGRMAGEHKNEVIIPAYTCPSVGSAVVRAGFKIRLIDVDPSTFDYKYEEFSRVDFSRTLAIVGCNLFAILNDWDKLRNLAKQNSVFLIDDAAQSMGSVYQGTHSGCLGDVGFFSLDRGKNLSTYYGGILITNNEELANEVSGQIESLKPTGIVKELDALIKIILYFFLLRPRLYWFPDMLPMVSIGKDTHGAYFPEYINFENLSSLQRCAGIVMFPRLLSLNESRRQKAKTMAQELAGTGRYVIPGYNENNCPAYLRLPLIFPNRQMRDKALKDLKKMGIQASTMYFSSMHRIAEIDKYLAAQREENYAGADEIVDKLLTLPTHGFMDEKRMRLAIDYLTH
jgi:dTDP-4-amino-4,6-dideoxygalactose transaminase